MTQPFRIGLIGADIIGQLRARAVGRIAHARLVAVAAANRNEAEAVRREHPNVRVLPDGESLAKDDAIDGVIITTDPVTHEPLGLVVPSRREARALRDASGKQRCAVPATDRCRSLGKALSCDRVHAAAHASRPACTAVG